MHRPVPHIARRRLAPLAAAVACLGIAVPAATPAPEATARKVSFALKGNGIATWSIDWPKEKGQEALRYNWSSTLKFNIPTRILNNPTRAKFKVRTSGTLRGSWTGVLSGTVFEGFAEGPYRCEYKGSNVTTPVTAELSNGATRGRLLITLYARRGTFFASSGTGTSIDCISPYGKTAPPHFDPGWLFRDTYTDRGRLSRDTAYIGMTTNVLTRKSGKVTFPNEVGARDSNFTGNIRWKNRGVLNVKTR